MKARNILTLLGILLTPSILGANRFHQPAKADPIESKMIYVDLSLNNKFLEENANPYIKYNDGGEHTISLTSNNKLSIYNTVSNVPIEVFTNEEYGFEIASFNGEYKTSWISGGNVLKDTNYNYICLNSYIENEDASIKGYGYFENKLENPGATYATQRVWLNNDNQFFEDTDNWGYQNVVGYFDNKNNYQVISMQAALNLYDNRYYYYADIPEYVASVHFMMMSKTENRHDYLIYQDKYIEYLSYGVCYFAGLLSYEDYLNMTNQSVNGATASMLHLVVESYLTYGKSSSNGCSSLTVRNLYNTWFKNKSASKVELKNEKILDYTGYSSNGNSYEGLTKTIYFSINEKWNAMCSEAGIDPNTGEINSFNLSFMQSDLFKMLAVIGMVAVIVCGGAIALMVIRRKQINK